MRVNRLYDKGIYSPWKLSLLHRLARRRRGSPPFAPKKILLCNTGRLGDVFIATRMVPRLAGIQVGLLVSSEGKDAAQGCPGVSRTHLIDPWYRSSDSKGEKWRRWLAFRKEVKERRSEFASYDTVFFCNPHYAGLSPLFPDAHTIGFDSHADYRQFSRVLPWNPRAYLCDVYREALDALGFDAGEMTSPWLSSAQEPFLDGDYCVLHIGASDGTKDYTSAMWRKVYQGLKGRKERIFFTGRGQRRQIEEITSDEGEILCDALSWQEFLRVIAHSQLVISVDTVAAHIAAAFDRRLITLYRDAPDLATWRPACGS